VADRVEDARDELGVVRRARDQLARADTVVVARVELERTPEDPVADAGVGECAVPDREVVPRPARDGFDQSEGGDPAACPPERGAVMVDDARIDRVADEKGGDERGALPGEAGADRADDRPAKPACDRPKITPACVPEAKIATRCRLRRSRTVFRPQR
jgi:hypothetical protein